MEKSGSLGSFVPPFIKGKLETRADPPGSGLASYCDEMKAIDFQFSCQLMQAFGSSESALCILSNRSKLSVLVWIHPASAKAIYQTGVVPSL